MLVALLAGLNVEPPYEMPRSLAIGTYTPFVNATVRASYAIGGRHPRTRGIFAIASGQRTVPAALAAAAGGSDDPVVMVRVGAVAGLALQFGMARLLRARMAKMG